MPNKEVIIALLRDGFNDQSEGGDVHLRHDHSPDSTTRSIRSCGMVYAGDYFDGGDSIRRGGEVRDATARIGLAIHVVVAGPRGDRRAADGAAVDARGERPRDGRLRDGIGRAHVVVDGTGRHHQVGNLFVFDGSVFPTSIGANPQLSIYGVVARNASLLATAMTGR